MFVVIVVIVVIVISIVSINMSEDQLNDVNNEEKVEEEEARLSLFVIDDILDYVHPDLKKIVHREGNDYDKQLSIGMIMSSKLEDYYESVLLSSRFKNILCDACAKLGQLESLIWARSKGCPWIFMEGGQSESKPNDMDLLSTMGVDDDIASGLSTNSEFMSCARKCFEPRPRVCYLAAGAGHLHILQWARANGCDWDSDTCCAAAKAGHLHILQWALLNGCMWNKDICSAAAGAGHLHILEWLRMIGGEGNSGTCSAAAGAGHLHILQWLRANGCDWDSDTCRWAARAGHLHILQWARANGCDWDSYLHMQCCS